MTRSQYRLPGLQNPAIRCSQPEGTVIAKTRVPSLHLRDRFIQCLRHHQFDLNLSANLRFVRIVLVKRAGLT